MSEDAHRDFLLSALRAASLRARMFEVEINSIGIALKGGMVTVPQALTWVRDIGAMELIGMIPDEIAENNSSGP